ncbi:hypothetical protein M5689_019133 [Euphorbia peplus]|nr:hypothetical protein M5689_019133 [Euphorbia peplus]
MSGSSSSGEMKEFGSPTSSEASYGDLLGVSDCFKKTDRMQVIEDKLTIPAEMSGLIEDVQNAFRTKDKHEIFRKIHVMKSTSMSFFFDELDSYLETVWAENNELKKKVERKDALIKKLKKTL